MLEFIHAADLHIGASRKLPNYLERQEKMIESIFDAARSSGIKLVLLAGDIYDRADLRPKEKDMFIRHLAKADADGITTVIISGNHDILGEDDGGYTHLRTVKELADKKRLKNTLVVEMNPEGFVLDKFNLNLICIPSYYRKPKEVNTIAEGFDFENKQYFTVALVHETILGSKNDYSQKFGVDLGHAESCVDLKSVDFIDYWALGDIHTPQKLNGLPAWYPGSPIQHNFGDIGPRGFLRVKLEKGCEPEVENLQVNTTQLVTFDVDESSTFEDIPSESIVRLVGTRDDISLLGNLPENVLETKYVSAVSASETVEIKTSDAGVENDIVSHFKKYSSEYEDLTEDDRLWIEKELALLRK